MGLFSQTSGGSVLENIALVGANVTGKNNTGALVGNAAGTVRQSFASGFSQGGDNSGGLIGEITGVVEDSFTVVMMTGGYFVGGLAGTSSGSVFRSFTVGSTHNSGDFQINLGGLIGTLSTGAVVSHSFTTGDTFGDYSVAGLVGVNNDASISDSYAAGTSTGLTGANASGLVGGTGTATRSYRVDAPSGGNAAGTQISLANLRALACANAIFEDADGNTCDASNEDVFPWDFGSDADLPVINGLVGGLDAEGQRRAVEFSRVDRTLTGAAGSVNVAFTPIVSRREATSVLRSYWVLPSSLTRLGQSGSGDTLVFTAPALTGGATSATYALHLTVVERDAAGTLLAVYADEFTLTVN